MNIDHSLKLFEEARELIPGGVNSPVRACRSVGCTPLFIERAQGSRIFDVDGNSYIDYVGSWGPMILGHRHPEVIKLIEFELTQGTSFGAPTVLELRLAEMVKDAVPSIEMVRMVNSGTEATMSAVRLARAFTGRDAVVKFDGCYHGHADSLLVAAGSGVATLGIPGSPGIPQAFVAQTISLPYNDIDAVTALMNARGDDIACIIVEPVAGNMGCVPPVDGFLETLRKETEKHGTVLVFDEVMTGFRVAYGGAQALYGITPDLTCLAKIIGGGLPVGAYGGRRDIMEQVAPAGPMYQAGTLSGNPLAMAAGVATLKQLQEPGFYDALDQKSRRLAVGLEGAAAVAGIPVTFTRVGSMLGMFFTDRPVTHFEDAKTSDLKMFAAYYNAMLERGIYLAPSQFEAAFVSAAHTREDIDETVRAAAEVLKTLAAGCEC
ncbi:MULTISPECIES: glutamate-1-semialdehyde 2,1-aminomutase [Desulfococcus]|uniref:Glutamate-1-semialdehyde 2,1-aminomutase n=1 Tax=Desulfococcus multivorans DSM 2059 TaxID=1121405 RepID=S7TGJ9_DESML|nr:glutamate-1-semialdehyde 2,1-aminomutase [Desulfococcus multivorans]AOY59903.1 HemL: glutamate-1-semialdehyde 2,1-aminomutase [Desulfococcus multivorans]AQV03083.1 aspartate aminotransferase family protein [Desulfococcus multivorans]EPR35901.1 Glutamate-1-semialdehyde 2,1-aminomutase [Desulfococcus multivorans DSM 2059]MDX9818714.1 glutamate-1-semialdehyde 2,1-aminomutase [Desulfococcus multivorans]SJZ34739.1 glutamate-1-semialdehyde 2,1-aminomutase [Desulfococcus multivorans DSM 2059]